MGEKMGLDLRYYAGLERDALPYRGVIRFDEATGFFYDEEGDVVDQGTVASWCEGDGRGEEDG